ncbi:conserved domain protein [Bacteroides fluxus YIT 12057]|uniref:Conserved domain protein n=1 Tax=Bacteroides fluxus YIT 12057 TaxID=763034 RepID=F3PWY1_9BACE|nr:conserved domain protein [Bacteroides fluxus YIT 12057]
MILSYLKLIEGQLLPSILGKQVFCLHIILYCLHITIFIKNERPFLQFTAIFHLHHPYRVFYFKDVRI